MLRFSEKQKQFRKKVMINNAKKGRLIIKDVVCLYDSYTHEPTKRKWFKKNKNSESLKKEYEDHKNQWPNDKRSISNFAREYFYLTFYW